MTLDYTGQHGGLLAMAFAAGVTFATSVLLFVGRFIWKQFLDKQVSDLRLTITKLETELRSREDDCERRLSASAARISQLETILLLHGNQSVRAAVQAAISETRAELDILKEAVN